MNINMLNDKFWDINVSLTSFESKSSPGPYHYQLIHKQRNKLDSWTVSKVLCVSKSQSNHPQQALFN